MTSLQIHVMKSSASASGPDLLMMPLRKPLICEVVGVDGVGEASLTVALVEVEAAAA